MARLTNMEITQTSELLQLNHYEAMQKFAEVGTKPRLSVLLHNVSRSENIAAAIRLADSVSAQHIFLFGLSKHRYEKNITSIRRMSRTQSVDVILPLVLDPVLSAFFNRTFCVEVTRQSVSVFEVPRPAAEVLLIAGSESNGLPESLLRSIPQHVHIPMYGAKSSMNVASALSVCAHVIAHKQTAYFK